VRYPATIIRGRKYTYATLVDCPGAMTQADPGESIEAQAADLLEGWLESELASGRTLPRPRRRLPTWPTSSLRSAVGSAGRWVQLMFTKRPGAATQPVRRRTGASSRESKS
jgi:predicted RNase H-like HicB family nuclease